MFLSPVSLDKGPTVIRSGPMARPLSLLMSLSLDLLGAVAKSPRRSHLSPPIINE